MNTKGNNQSAFFIASMIAIFCVSLFAVVLSAHAKGAGTGVDPIFDLMGVAKPTAWNTWSEREKFAYLQERGAYPMSGRKYQGHFDLDRYFTHLGIAQPSGWSAMTVSERQSFINALHDTTTTQRVPAEETIEETINEEVKETQLVESIPVASGAVEKEKRGEASVPITKTVQTEESSPIDTPWVRVFFVIVGGSVIVYALQIARHAQRKKS